MDDLTRAEILFKAGGHSCVLVKGSDVLTCKESGIAPLLNFIESGKNFSGFCAADKIVGKAAALLYAGMSVSAVYAEVLSTPAKRVLEERGIAVKYGTLTENIINRRGDGQCPMEFAVAGINDPQKALEILKEKVHRVI